MESINKKKGSSREEFSTYAKNLYSNSLVTGIPEIVVASNWYLRIIRFVIFVCCIIGFIYQSLDFMNLYWKYPTILDIQITRKGEVMMPGLTACDPSGIRLSMYCKTNPCKIPKAERRFCRCFPTGRYCNKKKLYPGLLIPAEHGDMSKMGYLHQDDRKYMMPDAKSFIPSCVLKRPPSTNYENCKDITMNPTSTNRDLAPKACFSINSLNEMPNKEPPNISVSTTIELELYSPPSEYDPDMLVMYKQLSLHSPYALSNPFNEGILLRSEQSYKIYVKQVCRVL
ncbi:uncharacterized protein NPIL_102261 [Nephila pilipes]|uniref:Uncharacterized protein n=1 Tax=Nephila pilipes TaxID=299642 RepID=A0A8X6T3X5_NEPPI|nr:uncharacterized protein NPIL_102261 [Nephila pilipes]